MLLNIPELLHKERAEIGKNTKAFFLTKNPAYFVYEYEVAIHPGIRCFISYSREKLESPVFVDIDICPSGSNVNFDIVIRSYYGDSRFNDFFPKKNNFVHGTISIVKIGELNRNMLQISLFHSFQEIKLTHCNFDSMNLSSSATFFLNLVECNELNIDSSRKIFIKGLNYIQKEVGNRKIFVHSQDENSRIFMKYVKGETHFNAVTAERLDFKYCEFNKLKIYESNISSISSLFDDIGELLLSKINTGKISGEGRFIGSSIRKLTLENFKVTNNKGGLSLLFSEGIINQIQLQTSKLKWEYGGIVQLKNDKTKSSVIGIFKNHYNQNQDVLNSQLMNAFEKRLYLENNKTSIPLRISWLSNSFGLSLGRPLMWILFFVLTQSGFLLYLSGDCAIHLGENWGIFFNLLNPAHKTSHFIDVFDGKCEPLLSYENWLYVIDNITRIIIGYMIFQFANAFRFKFKLR